MTKYALLDDVYCQLYEAATDTDTEIYINTDTSLHNYPPMPGAGETGVVRLMNHPFFPTKTEIVTYTTFESAIPFGYRISGCTRGALGTTAQSWDVDDYCIQPPIAAMFKQGSIADQDADAVDINGGTADDLSALSVAADSSGNVSRYVMSTAAGGTGTEDGADTWAKIATLTMPATNEHVIATFEVAVTGNNTLTGSAVVRVEVGQYGSGLSSTYSAVSLAAVSAPRGVFQADMFKLVGGSTNGDDVELWAQKPRNYCLYHVAEVQFIAQSGATMTYHDGAPWQSTTPTGTVNVTSAWATSGWQSPTLGNSWTGTIEHALSGVGNVTIRCSITPGTTTANTLIATLEAGFRHNAGFSLPIRLTDSAGADAGSVVVEADGEIRVAAITGTGALTGTITYPAEQ